MEFVYGRGEAVLSAPAARFQLVLQLIGLSADLDDMGMVPKPIQQCSGQRRVVGKVVAHWLNGKLLVSTTLPCSYRLRSLSFLN